MASSAVQGERIVCSPLAAPLGVGMLGYAIKAHLHTDRGAQRNNRRSGSQITACLAYSRPITGLISPSYAHFHKPRGTTISGNPRSGLRRGTLFWPLKELSQESPSCIVQAWNPSRWVNSRAPFKLNGLRIREAEHIMLFRGRAFGEKTTYGMHRTGITRRECNRFKRFGMNKSGKIEE